MERSANEREEREEGVEEEWEDEDDGEYGRLRRNGAGVGTLSDAEILCGMSGTEMEIRKMKERWGKWQVPS